ncbi:hypothetical protein EDF56_104536 [Novosphingobium sp. PhB165]|uniref:hypothetical protein n=1 Tax=Novosphingobium sp. PhB165 TaxID=2485105 RepID=UPI00104A4A26|nr:hypothetical protein [Novosphingobium sp. PhB165]TCM19001.1 hypothetical protein EDF56_104536 [Novosphingobium sp. PhB165]
MDLVHQYERAIDWIVSLCPQPDKFAHTYAGLTIWLIAAILMRRKLSSPWPVVVVAVAEAANEYMDRLAHGSWRWPDTIGDAIATLFWPLIIMMALRLRPALRG